MRKEFLEIVPIKYQCIFCNEWHGLYERKPFSYYDSELYVMRLECENNYLEIYFDEDYSCCYKVHIDCACEQQEYKGKIPLEEIQEDNGYCKISFSFRPGVYGSRECLGCQNYKVCPYYNEKIEIIFEFDAQEYSSVLQLLHKEFKEERKTEKEQLLNGNLEKEQQVKENKEETTMEKTTIWNQLYEHSPKENVEIAKKWAEKYKDTLKWVIPVVSIYSAYRILNSKKSGLTIDNIDKECQKKLGFKLEALKDKKVLGELMVLGGLSAGAYTAIKAISAIYNKNTEDELSVEEIEDGMEKLDGARKKFGWIQPKTEAMLPVAVSVVIVYVMTQKPAWFESIKNKASRIIGDLSCRTSVYLDMAKLFVTSKLNVNLDNPEEAEKFKKFALLATIVGIGVILYGRKILGKRANMEGENETKGNEKLEKFITQLLSIMKKMLPSAFAGISTFLITRKVLKADDVVDISDETNIDGDYEELPNEDVTDNEDSTEAPNVEKDNK